MKTTTKTALLIKQNEKTKSKLESLTLYGKQNDFEKLKDNEKNIYNLQKFCEILDKYDFINDKNYIKNVGLKITLNEKVELEKVVNYFFEKLIDGELKTVNNNIVGLKLYNSLSKSEKRQVGELDAFNFKSQKINDYENLNNKIILEKIGEDEKNKKILEEFKQFLKEKQENKNIYKNNCLNYKDDLNYKKLKKQFYKDYQLIENNINNKINRRRKLLKDFEYLLSD